MRTLNNHEINSVAGASYSEDIMTAAATLYVGGFLARVGFGAGAGIAKSIATQTWFSCIAPMGFAASVVLPIMGGIGLPAMAAVYYLDHNPELRESLGNGLRSYLS